VYALSTGPVALMVHKDLIPSDSSVQQAIEVVFWPVEWAAEETPLRKPIGMYLHFWVPKEWDSQGNEK
jgi:hypothetical protein